MAMSVVSMTHFATVVKDFTLLEHYWIVGPNCVGLGLGKPELKSSLAMKLIR